MMSSRDTHEGQWSKLIPDAGWTLYQKMLTRALERNLPLALGGGFAYSYYARSWRETKDLDLYILPETREAMIQVLHDAGFHDYFDQLPYDRRWIYRGHREGLITDLIWAMANQRTQVDEAWLREGPSMQLSGLPLKMIPLEELIWSKLYILQRDRCDWPDLLTLFHVRGSEVNWERLLTRIQDDARLLGAALGVFAWLCPSQAREFPEWLWSRVGIRPPAENHDCLARPERISLLDSRDWFPPLRESPVRDARSKS